jgi:hypothetical protein
MNKNRSCQHSGNGSVKHKLESNWGVLGIGNIIKDQYLRSVVCM